MAQFDDAVIGAGIIGLAHAYHLAQQGRRVAVFERSNQAEGASVRNFGMIWPIGQPVGPARELALRSREIWQEVALASGLWHEPCGSLHLAYHDDEWQVLCEFADNYSAGLDVERVPPSFAHKSSPRIKMADLRGALWSATEMCVDAKRTCRDLTAWLHAQCGVAFHFGHCVTAFDGSRLLANGQTIAVDRLWICSGADLHTLYPEHLSNLGLVACKLQMMRTNPANDRLGPMLAAGLTLRHYAAFAQCPTLVEVRARVTRDHPAFDRYGIHVMVSQNSAGELVIGDSHEYGAAIEPFDKEEIDRLILGYLLEFLDTTDLRIAARWHGIYLKHPERLVTRVRPAENVLAIVGAGGAGMTLSFGIAEQSVNEGPGMSVKLVVFDLAGTTVLDPGGVNGCFRAVLGAAGVTIRPEDADAVMGLPKLEAVKLLLRQYQRDDLLNRAVEIHDDFKARMINYYRTDPGVGEVPGAIEVFRLLKQNGVAVAVNTGFGREITNVLLARLGWRVGDMIDASICSDEVVRGRPHPDMIETLMMQLGITDPKQVAKIGDTPSDLGEGTAAGCGWVIGVTQGSHSKEQMLPHPHTHLIDTVAQLPEALGLASVAA